MTTRKKTLIAGASALALAAGGVGVAQALSGDDESEGRVSGPAADTAAAAALKLIPGGKVNAVEVDSEKGATWEVEVARPDGSVVDVRLDEAFKKVAIDGDSEAHDTEE